MLRAAWRRGRVATSLKFTLALDRTPSSSRAAFWLQGLRNRIETAPFAGISAAVFVVIIAVYAALSFHTASRQLGHDELYTYYIAQAPSISRLFEELRAIDLNPPLSYLLVRGSLKVFGDSSLATRLPFILGFLIGSLCFCKFVANRLRPLYGLLAMLVFWSTPAFYYATEARPYGLIVCFFGIAMLAWQRAVQPQRSAWSVLVLGLAVTGMMLSHLFSVFYICSFGLAELWRWYRSRKLDLAIWAALLIPALIVIVYIPIMRRYEAGVLPPVQQASPFKVFAFFYHTLEPESLILLVAVCLALLVAFRRQPARAESTVFLRPVEVAFTIGLLAVPALLNVALILTHGAFFPRYGLPALFAYGLLIAFFVAAYTNLNRSAAAIACCVLVFNLIGVTAITAALSTLRSWGKAPSAAVQLSPLDQIEPQLPLVAASGLTFLEMDKYGTPDTVARLTYLTDRSLAIEYAHATLFEGLADIHKYFPVRAHVEAYPSFVAEHPNFLVLGTPEYQEEWLIRRLLDIHATLQYLGPYKDAQLYKVTMPAKSDPGD